MSQRLIPLDAIARQTRAANPRASVFVSANAGSGKTHVLVQRVTRLLLDGVSPEKILCVTFTKAAAANMSERVFATLGRWVTLDDDALDQAILATGLAQPDAALRDRARTLFACALETPGGLKVQTIHALCARLLQQFPFEANVPARFAVMDERDQTAIMTRAHLDVLLAAAAAPDSAEGRALQTAMTMAADVTFQAVLTEACGRGGLAAWLARAGSVDAAMAELANTLGVAADDTLDRVARDIVDGPLLPQSRWAGLADLCDTGNKTDLAQATRLRRASASSGLMQADLYSEFFFTEKGTVRANILTQTISKPHPKAIALLKDEAERLLALRERRRTVAILERTRALAEIASRVMAHYETEKRARGLLDYNDLIARTLTMLRDVQPGWVHYKLDRGIDHVLIDEAQDTSPDQWDIIDALIGEFASGAGARDGVRRTVFAVGDEKQSIFSFQGAAPREFDRRRRALQSNFEKAKLPFELIAFRHSFRSGGTVLKAVDAVFQNEDVYRSIHAAENAAPLHESLADAGPSLIDLWPLDETPKKPQAADWRESLDVVAEDAPQVKLAQRIRDEIQSLVGGGVQTGPQTAREALRYGDMLVLVRRRGALFDTIIQTLKHAGVPVAGADRLKLTSHIAIVDLMNLADALLLPQDDLALAVALKSPLFGLDDDDLFHIAWDRKGSLRAAFQARAGDARSEALKRLEACERRASLDTPFGFFAWLLGGDGGRARILRRLGTEANDALDEFLDLALAYERRAPASLQGFLAWLRAADTDIKRDMEMTRDEVRVMTVHGAKGLEAPIVFLIDTAMTPQDLRTSGLVAMSRDDKTQTDAGMVVWAAKKDHDPAAVADARAAQARDADDEYRRLLYVAMTRAADRLIVGGCRPGNRKDVRETSWYALIEKGLAESGLSMTQTPPPDGVVKRYVKGDEIEPPHAQVEENAPSGAKPLPDWLRRPAIVAPQSRLVLRPSDGDESSSARTGSDMPRAAARQRGERIHRLLQSLPDVPPDRRLVAAQTYLARHAGDWPDDVRAHLAGDLVALLATPAFAAVFAPGSRAEAAIVGRLTLADGRVAEVAGQVDRLVVGDDVLIVDYKTGAQPAETPAAYLRQLGIYRAVLRALYADRTVRAAILWTDTPALVELPAGALDAAFAGVTRAP